MNKIYIELKPARSLARLVERVVKQGNTYVIFIRDDFDSSKRTDLEDLANELNRELQRDGFDPLNIRDRQTENELRRLKIGGRVEVRIN